MVYLFLGDKFEVKEQKITELRRKILASADAEKFDFEQFDGAKLDPAAFKKALVSLPVFAKQRVVLLRNLHKLSTHNQTLIMDFADSNEASCVVIGDCPAPSQKGFLKKLALKAKVLDTGTAKKLNVFDMTRSIERQQTRDALKTLSVLLDDGNHPLQIMGGLVWFWGRNKNKMSPVNFQKGLRELQMADLNIKRSKLQPDHAVEILVTKLCVLSAR